MPLSAIVLVVLRLFCLSWLIEDLNGLAYTFEVYRLDLPFTQQLLPYLFIMPLIVIGWIIAPALSRLVIGKHDAAVPISGLSLGDLYAFAFVFRGLYFALSSVADSLNWFHYFLRANSGTPLLPSEQMPSYYSLSRPLITLIAGLVCLFPGRRWARKLAASEQPSTPIPG